MAFVLDGTTLPDPNEFSEEMDPNSSYNKTLDNTRRRAVRNLKTDYVLTFNMLTTAQYNSLYTSYIKFKPVSFVNADLGIDTMVHIDITDHGYMAGTGEYLSNVSIRLTEM